MSIRETARVRTVFTIVLACLAALVAPGAAGAVTLPAGFQQTTSITGLNTPMDVDVTPAGQVFVAEKSGTSTPSAHSTRGRTAPPRATPRR